ncbi:MAG: alpha/beta hydrolase [Lachnospiraceae bacterium]|nr:alpha/beta hydrolase [Lachnospiraceae bacterium]
MNTFPVYLKDHFAELAGHKSNPVLTAFLHDEPGRADGKRPCILILPGGGYHCTSPREGAPIAKRFFEEDFNTFVLDYSTEIGDYPKQLIETAASVELICQKASEWGCDETKIAILGFSAGGHLAAHYSNAYKIPEVRSVFPGSRPVNASVLCYPVITAEPEQYHFGSFVNLLGRENITREEIDRLSCEKLVTAETPPAFIWHTASDEIVPVANSILYAEALADKGIPFELHIYPFGKHGLATADNETNENLSAGEMLAAGWIRDAAAWLKIILE